MNLLDCETELDSMPGSHRPDLNSLLLRVWVALEVAHEVAADLGDAVVAAAVDQLDVFALAGQSSQRMA